MDRRVVITGMGAVTPPRQQCKGFLGKELKQVSAVLGESLILILMYKKQKMAEK